MEARKEAFKQSLKSELALANAQQLINVRLHCRAPETNAEHSIFTDDE